MIRKSILKLMFYTVIFVIIFTAIIALQFKIQSTSKDYCVENSDCVASTCCHPGACVNKNYAPNCAGVFCTMECRPGTMDCDQGYCACINNKCKAIIK
jgi:hypothetical protein